MSRLIILHGCATLQLTKGQNTLIDAADYPVLSKQSWQAAICNGEYYAVGKEPSPSHGIHLKRNMYLHRRLLMDELKTLPPTMQVDHKSRDTLDNRRNNLRPATECQNRQNSRKRASQGTNGVPSSQYKGVSWRAKRNQWRVVITKDKRQYELGSFKTEIEAARAYNRAAIHFFGEFACVNKGVQEIPVNP